MTRTIQTLSTAALFVAVSLTSVALGQISITPSNPTIDGREFFVFAAGVGQRNIVVHVRGIKATDNALQKAVKIHTAFAAAGLRPRLVGGTVVVPGMKFMRWNSYTGEARDAVTISGNFVQMVALDGEVTAMNDEGQPAVYRMGINGPGFSAEAEISALDLPPNVDVAGVTQMLHQQIMQQLPPELHPHVFYDQRENIVVFDTVGMPQHEQPLGQQQGFEVVWGSDDPGLQPSTELEIMPRKVRVAAD
ncbi:MAG: hypothetical protein AAF497_09800 [Planctomycetota bacterium]